MLLQDLWCCEVRDGRCNWVKDFPAVSVRSYLVTPWWPILLTNQRWSNISSGDLPHWECQNGCIPALDSCLAIILYHFCIVWMLDIFNNRRRVDIHDVIGRKEITRSYNHGTVLRTFVIIFNNGGSQFFLSFWGPLAQFTCSSPEYLCGRWKGRKKAIARSGLVEKNAVAPISTWAFVESLLRPYK